MLTAHYVCPRCGNHFELHIHRGPLLPLVECGCTKSPIVMKFCGTPPEEKPCPAILDERAVCPQCHCSSLTIVAKDDGTPTNDVCCEDCGIITSIEAANPPNLKPPATHTCPQAEWDAMMELEKWAGSGTIRGPGNDLRRLDIILAKLDGLKGENDAKSNDK